MAAKSATPTTVAPGMSAAAPPALSTAIPSVEAGRYPTAPLSDRNQAPPPAGTAAGTAVGRPGPMATASPGMISWTARKAIMEWDNRSGGI